MTFSPAVYNSPKSATLKSELEYMSFHGQYLAVYERYHTLSPQERVLYASKEILTAVILCGIQHLKKYRQNSPIPGVRSISPEKAFVEEALNLLIEDCVSRNTSPRSLFKCIIAWIEELGSVANPGDILHYFERADSMGVHRYPDLHAQLILKRGEFMLNAGNHEEAFVLLSALAEKYYLVPDRNLISGIILALGKAALLTGHAHSYKELLFSGLRHFYTRDKIRLLFAGQLATTYRRFYRIFSEGDRPISDKILFLTHWFYYSISKNTILKKIRFTQSVRLAVLAYVYFLNYRYWGKRVNRTFPSEQNEKISGGEQPARQGNQARKAILVTRAMGGIGDLLMMTPGLHALKEMHPDHEIFFATPQQYHQLFIGNSDVRMLDIETSILDSGAFQKWFNLTDCPAARIESRTLPDVRMNRIDIFAYSLGIRGNRLRKMKKRPRYFLTDEEKVYQRNFWENHRLEGKKVIGIQLHAAERYKDYPHMSDLVRQLAVNSMVILFHSGKASVRAGHNVIDPSPVSLRTAFALAAACDAIIAPDSSFVHFAAAFDIPCIVLAGPIDGKNRVTPYPKSIFVDVRRTLQCVPCWRNEDIPCRLTDMKTSVCMSNINPREIINSLDVCLSTDKHANSK